MTSSQTRGNSPREILKFLQMVQLKSSKQAKETAGFTLIELLVGLILAFLIIAPLLGFVVNMMNTDRQEQAKSTSEQELQVTADYITRDLQQAVYIYDADGIYGLTGSQTNIRSQLPSTFTSFNGVPVLVFWKRKFIPKVVPPNNDDTFVYSLVAYYLTTTDNTGTWSKTAQIRRLEIQDGVKGNAGTYLDPDCSGNNKAICRDPGFNFDLSKLTGNDNSQKLNNWKAGKIGADGTVGTEPIDTSKTPLQVLVDYIDQTPNVQPEACPNSWQQVLSPTSGFYVCVNSLKNTVKVFLRGNALARISPKNNNPPQYDPNKSSFFPTARIEVTGSGGLGAN